MMCIICGRDDHPLNYFREAASEVKFHFMSYMHSTKCKRRSTDRCVFDIITWINSQYNNHWQECTRHYYMDQ